MSQRYAPGIRVEIRDAEWRIKRVSRTDSTVASVGAGHARDSEQGIVLGWNDIRHLNPGDTVSKTYTDTQATGLIERTIVYEAPVL